MRMRSPSSAPPVLRRVGSTDRTAIFSLSPWSRRKRRTSSSVSELLPAPPVPVIPSTGATRDFAFSRIAGSWPPNPPPRRKAGFRFFEDRGLVAQDPQFQCRDGLRQRLRVLLRRIEIAAREHV